MRKKVKGRRHMRLVTRADGSRYFDYRFKDWQGIERSGFLSEDFAIAKKVLRQKEMQNSNAESKSKPFDWEQQEAKAQAIAEKLAAEKEKNRLTLKAWIDLCLKERPKIVNGKPVLDADKKPVMERVLPSARTIRKGKRRGVARAAATVANEHGHFKALARLLGDRWLDRIGSKDGERYEEARSREHILKHDRPTGALISPGTIRNELAALARCLSWARHYAQQMRRAMEEDDPHEVKHLSEHSGLSVPELTALLSLNGTPPEFSMPSSEPRSRLLSLGEQKSFFETCAKVAPPWFTRFSTILSETGLDVSGLIRLTVPMIHWDDNEIATTRPKTGLLHVVPITPRAAEALRAQIKAQKLIRVFNWEDDVSEPITLRQISHWHKRVCDAAGIVGFWARDWRHIVATRRAKMRVSPAILERSMGWAHGSNMTRVYVTLREGDIAGAFRDQV